MSLHAQIMAPLIAEAQRGRCIACDGPLPATRKGAHPGGRRRAVLCGDADCLRTYHQLRRSRVRELVALGLQAELRRAANAIGAANRKLGAAK